MRTPTKTTAAKPLTEKPAAEKPAASAATEAGATAKVETASAPAGFTPPPGFTPAPNARVNTLPASELNDGERQTVDQRIDGGIADAIAGRRPLPTPAAEGAAAIAEAPIDPRPGSGSLDSGFETPFAGLTSEEIASLNARLGFVPAAHLAAFRHFLAQAPIDPVRGQGVLDDRYAPADFVYGLFGGMVPEARAARPMPIGVAEISRDELERDPDRLYVEVKANREGHRRSGRAWSTTPAVVPADIFTDAQYDALIEDPAITVRPL